MQITLDPETRDYLRKLRKKERDEKRYIKISVILALDAGRSAQEVADIFGPDDATIYRYDAAYRNVGTEDYLKENRVPYTGKLTEEQRESIRAEVSSRLYTSAGAVAAWIACKFGIHYREKHVVKLLHGLGFRYKKTRVVPGKADAKAQEAHVATFEQLMAEKQDIRSYFSTMARIHNSIPILSMAGYCRAQPLKYPVRQIANDSISPVQSMPNTLSNYMP